MLNKVRDYELKGEMGSGAYGTVYRAWQPAVGRQVAVKVIRPEHASQPEFVHRFETEAQLVARLEHPHIVPVYDYWRDESGAYLVMRLLGGGSLKDRLKEGPLTIKDVARLVEDICRSAREPFPLFIWIVSSTVSGFPRVSSIWYCFSLSMLLFSCICWSGMLNGVFSTSTFSLVSWKRSAPS